MATEMPSDTKPDQEVLLEAQQELHNASNACAFGAFIQGKHPRFRHNRLLEQAAEKEAEGSEGLQEGQFFGGGPRWVYVYNHCDQHLGAVKLMLDSGSAANFVSNWFVERYGLAVEQCQSSVFKVIDGHSFFCQRQALVCWTVDSREEVVSTMFHVLPNGVDLEGPLVGEPFLQEFYGRLLDRDPSQVNATFIPQPRTTEEIALMNMRRDELEEQDRARGQMGGSGATPTAASLGATNPDPDLHLPTFFMQSRDDASLAQSVQSLPTAAPAAMRPARKSLVGESHPLADSEASLPRRPNPSTAASLFRSTLTPPGSRSASPAPSGTARSPSRALAGSVFGGGSGGFRHSLVDTAAADSPGDPLNLILKSFVPHIAIHGSADVDALVADKGVRGGLWELLRPFGERVQGKVAIRDSNGGSRTWDDFAVRFTRFGDGVEEPEPGAGGVRGPPGVTSNGLETAPSGGLISQVETVVDRHLRYAEDSYMGITSPATPTRQALDTDATSPYYALYLRRLLSGMPVACHESFAHPVACVIAISSRNPSPIEALRKLYAETTQGEKKLPVWVDGEYLRYYVLLHDEENSDITKSMALFDQMKRHFGLHCHLLRVRSSEAAETDDDSIPLPRSDWMTAAEELADIEKSDNHEDFEDPTNRYIFESDATAVRTFIREMVIQSVIPTMERNVSVWNDQVASRRRGISGRFMSLSKRFTFGGSSRGSGAGAGSTNNYDALGFYRPDTQEAIMRRLADFAFMLRDWKLAMSTYDLLRTDFQNDKAWKYHAAANEMAALALLIMPQSMSSKTRLETINQMLEQAFYSYHTRCNSLYGAIRCIILALELLRLRGGSGIDEAVRWGTRVLEARMVGPVGDALLRERMAICYASQQGVGSQAWGSRRRKSALWSVLGAEAWLAQSKFIQAQRCLNEARKMYSLLPGECGVQNFGAASDFVAKLNEQLKEGLRIEFPTRGDGGGSEDGSEEEEEEVDEESETLNEGRSRRSSVIPPGAGGGGSLETAPLAALAPARLSDIEDGGDRTPPGKDGFG